MRTLLVVTVALFLVVAYCCQLQAEAKPKAVIVPDDPKPFGGAAIIRGGRHLLDLNRRGAKEEEDDDDDDDKEPNISRGQQKQGETGDPNRLFYCPASTANCLVTLEYFDHENPSTSSCPRRCQHRRLRFFGCCRSKKVGRKVLTEDNDNEPNTAGGDQSKNGSFGQSHYLIINPKSSDKPTNNRPTSPEGFLLQPSSLCNIINIIMKTLLVISVALFLVVACLQAAEAKSAKYTIPEDPRDPGGRDPLGPAAIISGGRRLLDLNRRGALEEEDKEPNIARGTQSQNDNGDPHHIFTKARDSNSHN
ncbi:hypothetical protein L484_009273 [Morus notabilis]|uniref:Uncharacterized protein n=1 Tax=Morus notabilis TaxID=981085 RepID=W9SEG6_9ROSA|nr:hypothetical protein L484_009273 [Morus notabilis]